MKVNGLQDFAFIPSKEQIKKSSIHTFMKKHNIKTLSELSDKAKNDLDWYWKAVEQCFMEYFLPLFIPTSYSA